ncbi:MAG: hypothetical protein AB1646_19710 [Thermodesulfobacteriota bacterium]
MTEAWSMFEAIWAAVALVVISIGVLGTISLTLGVLTLKAVNRRALRDDRQDLELANHEREITEIRLDIAKNEREHRDAVHRLELRMLECRAEQCGKAGDQVPREEFQGLGMRFETLLDKARGDINEDIRTVHARIDEILGTPKQRVEK